MRRIIILAAIVLVGIAGFVLSYYEVGDYRAAFADVGDVEIADVEPEDEEVVDFGVDVGIDLLTSGVPAVSFSLDKAFYDVDIEVRLFVDDDEFDGEIYYTLDGSPPTEESRLYDSPIFVQASSRGVSIETIKAVAIAGGEASEVVTKSYIVGREVFERFTEDTYVFALSADPFDLYDDEFGIAVPGLLRREYIQESGDRNPDPPRPANYNVRERHIDKPFSAERPFYVEVFDNRGNQLLSQLAGGRVQGGWSRDSSQKSWRLIARNVYSDGKFRYPFFEDAIDINGQVVSKFDRLVLRKGANDREDGNMRDELSLELAAQAGFPDTQSARPAAVFLNGKYYGFAWLKESYSNGYLEQMYGGVKDNYQIIEKSEQTGMGDDRFYDEGQITAYNDWAAVIEMARLAVEHDGIPELPPPPARETVRYEWSDIEWSGTINEDDRLPLHPDVSYVDGDGSQAEGRLLQFSNIGLGDVVPDEVTIRFRTNPPADGNRMLNVWTDLSGANADKITFITNGGLEKVEQGLIAQSEQVSGRDISLNIPVNLIYDAKTNTFASEIYVVPSLYHTDDALGDIAFRRNTTDSITAATLTLSYRLETPTETDTPTVAFSEYSFMNDEVFEEFCSLVDIDNLMLYYAIEIFVDNQDWPNNNMRMYKYYAEPGEIITNDFNDGRWRFLMYDVEFAWGIYNNSGAIATDTLAYVLGRRTRWGGDSVLLQAVFQRPDMQEYFANTMCDLISGPFSSQNALKVIDEIDAASSSELGYARRAGTVNMWGNRNTIRDFARRRPDQVLNHLRRNLNIDSSVAMFDVSMKFADGSEGAEAWLNTRKVNPGEIAINSYFSCFEVPIRAVPGVGYEFVKWEINGVAYFEPEMTVNVGMMSLNVNSGIPVLSIVLHTNKLIDGMPLYIREVDPASGADWIELYNPNNIDISTRDYFLSDRGDNLAKWRIPIINIRPQSGLIIVMSNNKTPDALLKPHTNFSLRAGETLYLSDNTGEILGYVLIPALENGERLVRNESGGYDVVTSEVAEEFGEN